MATGALREWAVSGSRLVGYEFSRFDWHPNPQLNIVIEISSGVLDCMFSFAADTFGNSYFWRHRFLHEHIIKY